MKIDSEQLLSTVNKFKNEPVEKNETAGAAVAGEKWTRRGTDRVELSTTGSEIERLKKTMEVAPDFRSDRVAKLKEQIGNGSYRADSKAVAEKMLQSWRELHAR
jgi:negative regulator of flagellin synthesis FlgM